MALYTQNIGTQMPHGFAGTYSRQPDMIVNTFPCGQDAIPFGTPVKLSAGKVVPMGTGSAAADFIGIAAAEIKSSVNFLDQSQGVYTKDDAVAVFQRGAINVKCQRGTPTYNGAVYVRITENASYPTAVVGGFETDADSGKCIAVPTLKWVGAADSNGIAEARIIY